MPNEQKAAWDPFLSGSGTFNDARHSPPEICPQRGGNSSRIVALGRQMTRGAQKEKEPREARGSMQEVFKVSRQVRCTNGARGYRVTAASSCSITRGAGTRRSGAMAV